MSGKDSDEPIQRDPITRSSGSNVPPPDPKVKPKVEADEDEEEVSSPHGVGESLTRRGEDITKADGKEAGRKDTGTEGKAQRPTGTSDARDQTSVDRQ
jgi:hypothetical protein